MPTLPQGTDGTVRSSSGRQTLTDHRNVRQVVSDDGREPFPKGSLCDLIVCGASPTTRAHEVVEHAQPRAWDCHVIATDMGTRFIDRERLEAATGHHVTVSHLAPGTLRPDRDAANAVVIASATANTTCKLAASIADTYALDVAAECIGPGHPTDRRRPVRELALTGRTPHQCAVQALADENVTDAVLLAGSQAAAPMR